MKLVISTQIRENYGAHEWDGKGDCPQLWKNKGGCVFVVPKLMPAQVTKLRATKSVEIPRLTALIEAKNVAFEETVIGASLADDEDIVSDPWDVPYELSYIRGEWWASRVVKNDQYGYMNQRVDRKTEVYRMSEGGGINEFEVVYFMTNGDIVKGKDVSDYLTKMA